MKELFEYKDYRKYVLDWVASKPKRGRGVRAALAQAIRSPVSHISQVLGGVSDFTFEQAEEVNGFLGHNVDEAEYFLLLIHLARAGTPKLKRRTEIQMKKIQDKRLVLKERLEVKTSITPEHQALFYSSWQYAAIHVALTIEKCQTKEAIAQYLGISLQKASEMLEFLVRLGLARKDHGQFIVGETRVHLGHDSPMISKHHINWRMQAIQSLEREDVADALHYSSVVSIATKDMIAIKSMLIKAIESAKAVIRDSKAEELHALCLDFFKISGAQPRS